MLLASSTGGGATWIHPHLDRIDGARVLCDSNGNLSLIFIYLFIVVTFPLLFLGGVLGTIVRSFTSAGRE